MVVIFLGPPGSGKGTMSKLLATELKIPHISTGDILRDHIKRQTEIGKTIKKLLDAGQFAPNDLTNSIIEKRLSSRDCKKGFILDGYPRNIEQAIYFSLSDHIIDHVIYLKAADEEIIARLKNRASIEGRADDASEDLIKERIRVYNRETRPIIRYYENQSLLRTVESGEIVDVFNEIKSILDI